VGLPARGDALDALMAAHMRQLRLPGLAVAVVENGRVKTMRHYGVASLELGTPVTSDTVFELGSLSKQFTAVAILMLAEEGKLQLDDSIAEHLAGVPPRWKPITIRHLLTHSSGIEEYLALPGLPDAAHAVDHESMTRMFFERLKLEFDPGQTWAYSNSGYLLLGNIIESVSGQSYWSFLEERIFTPLGMTATRSSDPRRVIRNRARGYGLEDGVFVNREALSENAYSAGAIVSTLRDMVTWESALHHGRLLSPESYAEMWRPLRLGSGAPPPLNYGFGWVTDLRHVERYVMHSGGTPGFSSAISRNRDSGVTAILLANHGDRLLDHVAMEVTKRDTAPATVIDPSPQRTARLTRVAAGLWSGAPEPAAFTPAMRRFLATSSGRGLWQWVASNGELVSLHYRGSDRGQGYESLRYQAKTTAGEFRLTFAVTSEGEIAQAYWW
jgi:CubicO group peptidase (beta-lactamase class C family)